MPYKISGTLNDSARILVLKESDWSVESNSLESVGDYEIESLVSGTKTVVAINSAGEIVGYGNVESASYAPTGGNRGVFACGWETWGLTNVMDYISINSTGNASDFGDRTVDGYPGGTSNGASNRGIFVSGSSGDAYGNTIDYITLSSTGNATDFGDMDYASARFVAAVSNLFNDRGVFGGGMESGFSFFNTLEYITISTTGNGTDFGDLTKERKYCYGAGSNGTNNRGLIIGDGSADNTIDYITISTTGNASDFGDLTIARYYAVGTSNGTSDRSIICGGYTTFAQNVIDYVTISTIGNATNFGDLTVARNALAACSNGTKNRGVMGGGDGLDSSTIDYVTISTTGDATDFGDLTLSRNSLTAASNGE